MSGIRLEKWPEPMAAPGSANLLSVTVGPSSVSVATFNCSLLKGLLKAPFFTPPPLSSHAQVTNVLWKIC